MSYSRRQILGLAAASTALAITGGAAAGAELAIEKDRLSDLPGKNSSGNSSSQEAGLLWRFPVAPVSGAQAISITVSNGVVYLLSDTELIALTADSCRTIWKHSLSKSGPGTLTFGDDAVYLNAFFGDDDSNSYVMALNKRTGGKLWHKTAINSGLVGTVCDSKALYVGASPPTNGTGSIWAIDASSGRQIWQLMDVGDTITLTSGNDSQANVTSVDTPVFTKGNILYTASSYKLHARSKESGEEIWAFSYPGENSDGGPLLLKDNIYVTCDVDPSGSDSQLIKLDARTGQQLWSSAVIGGSFSFDTESNSIYALSEGNGISALNINNGSTSWARDLPSLGPYMAAANDVVLISVTPNSVDGGLLNPGGLSGETELCALQSTDGRIKWKTITSGGSLASDPVLTGDWAYVGFSQSIRALDMVTGMTRWDLQAPVVYGPIASDDVLCAVVADEISATGNTSASGAVCGIKI